MNLLDRLLIKRFLKIARQAHIDSGMALPPVHFDSGNPYSGIEILMKEVASALLGISGDQAERQRIFYEGMEMTMVRFFGGRLITSMLAKIMSLWPVLGGRMMNRLIPVAFQWLVGPVVKKDATTGYIPCCRFRQVMGEQACIEFCKKPTEYFFISCLHLCLELRPSERDRSCIVTFRT